MLTLSVSQRPYLQANEQGQSLGSLVTPAIIVLFDDVLPSNEWYLDVG